MLDVFKKPITVLIVVVAIAIAIGWSYVSNYNQNKKDTAANNSDASSNLVDLATVDAKDYDELIKTELSTANSKALADDSANRLNAIAIELPSLQLNAGQTKYIFSSANNPNENWTITFSEETGKFLRAKVPKDDYMGSLSEMNTSLWKFNYVTAIQIFEKNGAKEWRQSNGLSAVSIILKHGGQNNWLLWYMSYSSGTASFDRIIDANSGKVIEGE